MKMFAILATLAVVSAPAPLSAQSTTGAPQPVAGTAPEKKTCRSADVTGSIMPAKRICHTRSEWASIDGKDGGPDDTMRRVRDTTAGMRPAGF